MVGIIEIPDLMNNDECEAAMIKIDTHFKGQVSYIITDVHQTKSYEALLLPRLPKYVELESGRYLLTAFSPQITLGKGLRPIERHKDEKRDGTNILKLAIYLNDFETGGGTCFDGYTVSPKRGKGLLFDINLPHWGEDFEGVKYMVGFRINGKLVQPTDLTQ